MKLNKRGITLIELLISIVLIVVVMVFMFRMLTDITNEQTNNKFAMENQVNRLEIIKKIETDFIDNGLVGIDSTGSNENELVINFTFADNSKSRFYATKEAITYGTFVNNAFVEPQKWTVMGGSVDITKALVYSQTDGLSSVSTTALTINIEIHTLNDENNEKANNIIDDIVLSYMGDTAVLGTLPNCLGYSC